MEEALEGREESSKWLQSMLNEPRRRERVMVRENEEWDFDERD